MDDAHTIQSSPFGLRAWRFRATAFWAWVSDSDGVPAEDGEHVTGMAPQTAKMQPDASTAESES